MTAREALAGLLILSGVCCATAAGFLVTPELGLAVLGTLLLVLGLLLGTTAEAVVELGPEDLT